MKLKQVIFIFAVLLLPMISHAAINIPLPYAEQTLAENHNSNLSLGAMRQGGSSNTKFNELSQLDKTLNLEKSKARGQTDKVQQ